MIIAGRRGSFRTRRWRATAARQTAAETSSATWPRRRAARCSSRRGSLCPSPQRHERRSTAGHATSSPGGCLLGSRDCGASHVHTAVEDTPRTNADCHLAPGFCDIQTCMHGTKQ